MRVNKKSFLAYMRQRGRKCPKQVLFGRVVFNVPGSATHIYVTTSGMAYATNTRPVLHGSVFKDNEYNKTHAPHVALEQPLPKKYRVPLSLYRLEESN